MIVEMTIMDLLHDPEVFAKAMKEIDVGELREDIDELLTEEEWTPGTGDVVK